MSQASSGNEVLEESVPLDRSGSTVANNSREMKDKKEEAENAAPGFYSSYGIPLTRSQKVQAEKLYVIKPFPGQASVATVEEAKTLENEASVGKDINTLEKKVDKKHGGNEKPKIYGNMYNMSDFFLSDVSKQDDLDNELTTPTISKIEERTADDDEFFVIPGQAGLKKVDSDLYRAEFSAHRFAETRDFASNNPNESQDFSGTIFSSFKPNKSGQKMDDQEERERLSPMKAALILGSRLSSHPSGSVDDTKLHEKSPRVGKMRETNKVVKRRDPATGQKMINKYLIMNDLGKGVHGKVKLAMNTVTNNLYAVKVINKRSKARFGQKDDIKKEIAILKKCRHPNVVQLVEVIDDPSSSKMYLVLEYMDGGEMPWKDEDDNPILPENAVRNIFRDVLLGLEYIHYQGIIHRDIKPANLLWSKSTKAVKISDFGVSFFSQQLKAKAHEEKRQEEELKKNGLTPTEKPVTPVSPAETKNSYDFGDIKELDKTAGSPAFFAPELCISSDMSLSPFEHHEQHAGIPSVTITDAQGQTGNDETKQMPSSLSKSQLPLLQAFPTTPSVDIWALGVTLYCLIYGRLPFIADTEYDLLTTIPTEPLTVPWRSSGDSELIELLDGMLTKNPQERWNLQRIKTSRWVLNGLEDPEKWLEETDPSKMGAITVTDDEIDSALSIRRFKKTVRRITNSLRIWNLSHSSGFRSDHSLDNMLSARSKSERSSPTDKDIVEEMSEYTATDETDGTSTGIYSQDVSPQANSDKSSHEPENIISKGKQRVSNWLGRLAVKKPTNEKS